MHPAHPHDPPGIPSTYVVPAVVRVASAQLMPPWKEGRERHRDREIRAVASEGMGRGDVQRMLLDHGIHEGET